MKYQQQAGGLGAQIAPAMGPARLKHQAISRLESVSVVCDPVFNLAFQAESKLLSQVDDGIGSSTRLQRPESGGMWL